MRVSILIPCYNAQQWIAGAIDSALAQTWPDKEVIVVDDGSTDGSLEIIKKFGDRIRWETGPNRGGNRARNRLLALSTGEWLQYLDADDYLLPGKVAAQMEFLQRHPDTDVVFSPVVMEYCDAKACRQEILPIPEPHDPWILLARWYLPQTGAPLWRKQAVVDIGGWKESQPCCQEHELYLRLLQAGKLFRYCPDAGAVYRQWSEETVCKRDKPEVRRRRMEILEGVEQSLRVQDALRPDRLWSVNQARFETARSEWQVNKRQALAFMNTINRSQPDFMPGGTAAPRAYTWAYRTLGFRLAETIADWRRR